MSAPQAAALGAIAFQLVAVLEEYDRDTGAMITAWPDLDSYQDVSDLVERIRTYCAALPDTQMQWAELLIAHAELIHFLWRTQYGDVRDAMDRIGAVRDHHADCVAALRNRCLRLASRSKHRRRGVSGDPADVS